MARKKNFPGEKKIFRQKKKFFSPQVRKKFFFSRAERSPRVNPVGRTAPAVTRRWLEVQQSVSPSVGETLWCRPELGYASSTRSQKGRVPVRAPREALRAERSEHRQRRQADTTCMAETIPPPGARAPRPSVGGLALGAGRPRGPPGGPRRTATPSPPDVWRAREEH